MFCLVRAEDLYCRVCFTMHCIAVSEQLVYESSGVPVIFLTVASARFLSGDVQIGGNWHKSRKNQAHAYHARWGTRNRTDVVVHRSLVRLCREEIRRAPWFVSSRISYGQGAHSRRRMGCHGSPMGGKIQCNTIRYDTHVFVVFIVPPGPCLSCFVS